MQTIATKRGDNMSRFQNSLYLGDIQARVSVLRETGQCGFSSWQDQTHLLTTSDPLAYYTAKTNGLDDTALDILEEAGMTEDDLPPPPQNAGHSSVSPPTASFSQSETNWPIKDLGESFFDRALANGGADGFGAGEGSSTMANGAAQLDAWAADDEVATGEDEVNEDEGWDLDAEVIAAPEEEEVEAEVGTGEADLSEGVTQGVAENEMWVRNSPLAADHAAAGAFESAMQVSVNDSCRDINSRFNSCSTDKWVQSISCLLSLCSSKHTNQPTFRSPSILLSLPSHSMSVAIPKPPRCARYSPQWRFRWTICKQENWLKRVDSLVEASLQKHWRHIEAFCRSC